MILIGVDPGVNTGLAVWDTWLKKLTEVSSLTILDAIEHVKELYITEGSRVFVIVEDARKRKGFYGRADSAQAKSGAGIREGVGSVKRDCSIWEEFLTRERIPFEMRYPRNTKEDAAAFQRLTGWAGRTNEHSRDAGLIVFGMNEAIARAKLIAFRDGADAARTRPGHCRSGTRTAV